MFSKSPGISLKSLNISLKKMVTSVENLEFCRKCLGISKSDISSAFLIYEFMNFKSVNFVPFIWHYPTYFRLRLILLFYQDEFF